MGWEMGDGMGWDKWDRMEWDGMGKLNEWNGMG